MSDVPRINPRRQSIAGPSGVRRIELRKPASVERTIVDKPLRTGRAPQRWHMAIAHSDRGSLSDHARQAIAAAAILAEPDCAVLVLVLGDLDEDLTSAGADEIVVLPELSVSRLQPHRETDALVASIETYAPVHVFIPDNSSGDGDLGRRLIARLACTAATHVRELGSTHVSIGWSSGSALAHAGLPRVVLLDQGAVDLELPFVGLGKRLPDIRAPDAGTSSGPFRDLGLLDTGLKAIALEEADFIVSGGNGVANVGTLESLATALGASVGASRVAVDEGKFARDRQIGATGKTVSASAYIAVGISGAVQHLQGIKDCRHVIAINKDAGAPIVKRADLSVIGDAEDVMQALSTRIAQARAQREVPGGRHER